jgi:hypothetical protein
VSEQNSDTSTEVSETLEDSTNDQNILVEPADINNDQHDGEDQDNGSDSQNEDDNNDEAEEAEIINFVSIFS